MSQTTKRSLSLGDFRRVSLEEAKRQLQRAIEKAESTAAGGFVRRVPPPLLSRHTLAEIVQDIAKLAVEAIAKYPMLEATATRTADLAQAMLEAPTAERLLSEYRNLLALYELRREGRGAQNQFDVDVESDLIVFSAMGVQGHPDGVPDRQLRADQEDIAFIAAVSNLLAVSRDEGRTLTTDEHSAVLAAYSLLDRGVQLPTSFKGIGIYGLRPQQTCLSVANPGDGHIQVTCTSVRLLEGTVVHIEHIDRDGIKDRELLEPYRLPAAVNAARVRLHAGAAAPCTAYIGRPVFESRDVKRDLLKSVHMTASACTAMFMNGIADCKIGIERMTATEAVVFMRAVAGNVVRDPTRQYLSAAFNINLPFVDDRDGQATEVRGKRQIAELSIELVRAGRFDKVTWDGSSNKEPSDPFVTQVSHADLVDLVHRAHEAGLETYISAGMQPVHMRACVHMGVDGVGIGTSLHDYNASTGLRGQLKAERVREVLDIRDEAALEPMGRGAALLARLDRIFFEGSLPASLDENRLRLHGALRSMDSAAVLSMVESIRLPEALEPGPDHPVLEQARRVLASAGMDTVGSRRNRQEWAGLVSTVQVLLPRRDVAELYEVLP